MAIGAFIKETRNFLRMTQLELAEKAGISPQQLSQYERGVRTPSNKTLEKIAEGMGFNFKEFMYMYYLPSSNASPGESKTVTAVRDAPPKLFGDKLSALCQLMNASGYALRFANGEYYLTGKHGGYCLTEEQVQRLLHGSVQYIESMCAMLETTLMNSK